jgi:transcriptional regulator with PAS, ATPase and Fis domain
MPGSLQVKLLRVIPERSLIDSAAMSGQSRCADIAATSANLSLWCRKDVQQGLYYRLNVIPIHLLCATAVKIFPSGQHFPALLLETRL